MTTRNLMCMLLAATLAGTALAAPGSGSQRNMERLGFRVIEDAGDGCQRIIGRVALTHDLGLRIGCKRPSGDSLSAASSLRGPRIRLSFVGSGANGR